MMRMNFKNLFSKKEDKKLLAIERRESYYIDSKNVTNLSTMSGENFEVFLRDLFIYDGLKAELTPKYKDDGIDIIVTRGKLHTAIQAKRMDIYKNYNLVDKEVVNSLVGGARRRGIERTCIITTSIFTEAAQDIAAQEGMELIDGRQLYYLIAKIRPELLAEAYFEKLGYIKCPECGTGILKKREGRQKIPFIGCTNFPKCRHSMKITEFETRYIKQ